MPSACITSGIGKTEPRPADAGAFAADKHVLGDGEVRKELRFLMDHGDLVPVDAGEPRPAVEGQLPESAALRRR